jgi:hypothetical protein
LLPATSKTVREVSEITGEAGGHFEATQDEFGNRQTTDGIDTGVCTPGNISVTIDIQTNPYYAPLII